MGGVPLITRIFGEQIEISTPAMGRGSTVNLYLIRQESGVFAREPDCRMQPTAMARVLLHRAPNRKGLVV